MIQLSVMSFNLRYATANDGDNAWEHRKTLLLQMLETYRPDVIGTQEGLDFQLEYIVDGLRGYQRFGVSRKGNSDDEHNVLLYSTSRMSLVEGGNFWLSETPGVPNSKSWDSSTPRMATWAKFQVADSAQQFYCMNTHFDHRGAVAREESAKLVLQRIQSLDANLPLFLTGDFNARRGSMPWETLVNHADLRDAWEEAPIRRGGVTTTFHGFRGEATEAQRWQSGRWTHDNTHIDWALFRPGVRVKCAEVVAYNRDGRYPSDHYPVLAEFEIYTTSAD